MHNTLAVLIAVFSFASSTSALYFPRSRLTSTPQENTNKCTFTVWQKQLCTSATKTNYIQINEIQDHANHITIDLAALRPAAARNSYEPISPTAAFAVLELLDDKTLIMSGNLEDEDEVVFEYDDMLFSSEGHKTHNEASCVAGAWDNEDWACGMGSREKKMDCEIPCGLMVDEDEEKSWIGELR